MFFKKRATVDANEEAWVLSAWRWLDDVLGSVEPEDTLWLPTAQHFPPPNAKGHDAALHDFQRVKSCCGMATWPTRLVAQRERPRLMQGFAHDPVFVDDPGGTFSRDMAEDVAVVTYDPELLQIRSTMIFVFAHELSHYALSEANTACPGGDDFMELTTDLGAAHLGFGLFGANCFAKQYGGTNAYMPEHMWSYVTALYCELVDVPAASVEAHAKPWVSSGVAKNRAYLRANPHIVASLKSP
jgi:hypothetical protein